ncbi:hypothetical protein psal_cds_1345 [Pandoravirus salinus]|uniref:Uncharacterized protein n=1 Tax=Pandoravirus salinus TaxID=1349410 RepID=S4VZE2_9VIRU|nr:hypothetical protein psal_cds_1345 [Pandoravirus salinus]AGO85738.1 hypothetical protein psal_cds_1345 [Pandoravirus salinus]
MGLRWLRRNNISHKTMTEQTQTPADRMDDALQTIEVMLCDDILYKILIVHLGAPWHPMASRVTRRWQAILSTPAARTSRLHFVDRVARLHKTQGMTRRWKAHVKALMAKAGPAFLHQGHLNACAAGGHPECEAWVRAHVSQPSCFCGAKDTRHKSKRPAACCCPTPQEWAWSAAAHAGRHDIVRRRIETFLAAGSQTRDLCHEIICEILYELALAAPIDFFQWLYDNDLLQPNIPTWTAVACSNRTDLLDWLRSIGDDCFYYSLFPGLGMRCPTLYGGMVAAKAAAVGAFDAVRWLGDTIGIETEYKEEEWPDVYYAALKHGHMPTLHWLYAKCPSDVDNWDDTTGSVYCKERNPSPWRATQAPTAEPLRWLASRGVRMPKNLLVWNSWSEYDGNETNIVPGCFESIVFAVSTHGCDPPDPIAMEGMAYAGRQDFLDEAGARGWIDPTQETFARLSRKAAKYACKAAAKRAFAGHPY